MSTILTKFVTTECERMFHSLPSALSYGLMLPASVGDGVKKTVALVAGDAVLAVDQHVVGRIHDQAVSKKSPPYTARQSTQDAITNSFFPKQPWRNPE